MGRLAHCDGERTEAERAAGEWYAATETSTAAIHFDIRVALLRHTAAPI